MCTGTQRIEIYAAKGDGKVNLQSLLPFKRLWSTQKKIPQAKALWVPWQGEAQSRVRTSRCDQTLIQQNKVQEAQAFRADGWAFPLPTDGKRRPRGWWVSHRKIWVWLKLKQEGLRRFWSMFPLTRFHFGTGFLSHCHLQGIPFTTRKAKQDESNTG